MIKRKNKYVSIDIGGTKLHIAILNAKYSILADKKVILKNKDIENILDNAASIINELIDYLSLEMKDISLIGVSVPSVINLERDTIIWSPNLEKSRDFNVREYFLSRLNLESILENDLNAAAIGEFEKIYKGMVENMVFISIGTGIGAGIIIGGKLYRGERNLAGSIGWSITDYKDLDRKGSIRTSGPLEENCSGIYFKNLASKINTNKKDYLYPEKIFRLYDNGDLKSKIIIEKMLDNLGIAISNISTLLDIGTFVIGGGIGLRLGKYLNYLEKIIKNNTQPFIGKNIELRMSKLKNAALIGAILSKK